MTSAATNGRPYQAASAIEPLKYVAYPVASLVLPFASSGQLPPRKPVPR